MIRRASIAAFAFLLLVGAVLAVLFLLGGKAKAPSAPQQAVAAAGVASIKIIPVRYDLPVNAGRSTVTYTVENKGKTARHLDVTVAEVSPVDAKLIPDSPASAAHWTRVSPSSFDLQPKQKIDVHATVVVPSNREPGERRIELYFRQRPTTKVQVNVTVALGASIWVPGGGTIDRGVHLVSLHGPFVANPGTVRLTGAVRNTGNVHRDLNALGTPVVGQPSSGHKFNFVGTSLLAGRQGTVTAKWKTPIACWCEVIASVPDGHGHLSTASIRVLVFPWALVLAVGLIVLILAMFVPLLIDRHHRDAASS